jgi:tetratricopeptide (TPR) repeat protein
MRKPLRDSQVAQGRTAALCRSLTLFCALILCPSGLIQAQTSPGTSTQTSAEIAKVIDGVRAKPLNAGKIIEARAFGFRLLAVSRYEDAWAVFKAILDAQPQDGRAMYGGALALFNLRQIAEAEKLARAAYESARAASQAIAVGGDYDSISEANRRASDPLVLLGVILAVKGDDAGALKAVEQAATLAPDNFDAQFALGRARYGAGDPLGAANAFRSAVALKADDPKARFFLATALEGAGEMEAALTAYRELLTIRPESAEGHLGLGVLLTKLGGERADEGIRELLRAINLNGDLYEARITLGRALLRKGHAQESVEHLQRAAALAPTNPEPHYQLALAYRRLGKTAEAERENAIVKEIHSARRGKNADDNSSPGMSSREQEVPRP